MSANDYINKQIETLAPLVGVPFSCWSAPEGLPNSVLQIEPVLLQFKPSIPLRIKASMHGDVSRLENFLKEEFGLTKGVDYERHHNGMRGGTGYFDFTDSSVIGRLEAYARDKGLKPKEYIKLDNPSWMKGPSLPSRYRT